MFRPFAILVLLIGGVGAASINHPAYPQSVGGLRHGAVAIRNVSVVPMTGAGTAHGQTVLVLDGRISQVGDVARVRIPENAEIVDGTGKFLIPGLVDMHVHMSVTRPSSLGLYVANGVTTIRDQGSDPIEVLEWRRQIVGGQRIGPTMLLAGPYLESERNVVRLRQLLAPSDPEAFARTRVSIGSPEEARRVIDSLASEPFDHFKVRTVQDPDTYLALADAVHKQGKRLVGHWVAATPELFLKARQDGVEHGFPTAWETSMSESARMAFWRELARLDVGVVPTLVAGTESFFPPAAYLRELLADVTGKTHPLNRYLSPGLIANWQQQAKELGPERSEAIVRTWPLRLKHAREMRSVGVRLMTGTDTGLLNVFPGTALHEELRLFVDLFGMSPSEALQSATSKPAEWLGVLASSGTISAGKIADLVLLDADPLTDIRNTKRISAVVLRGRLLRRRELDALLTAAKEMRDQ